MFYPVIIQFYVGAGEILEFYNSGRLKLKKISVLAVKICDNITYFYIITWHASNIPSPPSDFKRLSSSPIEIRLKLYMNV